MSDERQKWLILSADKIAPQKSVVCRPILLILSAKIDHVLEQLRQASEMGLLGRVEFTGRHRNTLRLLFHIYTV